MSFVHTKKSRVYISAHLHSEEKAGNTMACEPTLCDIITSLYNINTITIYTHIMTHANTTGLFQSTVIHF